VKGDIHDERERAELASYEPPVQRVGFHKLLAPLRRRDAEDVGGVRRGCDLHDARTAP
jgi:hypothetical protein